MKKLMLLAGALLAFASCQNGKFTYTVNGTLPSSAYDGVTMYLSDFEQTVVYDSLTVVGDKIEYQGNAKQPFIACLAAGRVAFNFIAEAGQIELDMTNMTAKGTPSNDWVTAFVDSLGQVGADAQTMEEWMGQIGAFSYNALKDEQDKLYGNLGLLYVLCGLNPQGETFEKLYSLANEEMKAMASVQALVEVNERLKATAPGQPFVDFTITDGRPEGGDVSLSDYVGKGKYILVDFWASWCGPCRREIPNIAEVYRRYHGANFDVLGIAVWDKPEETRKAAKELGIVWNEIINAQAVPTQLYGISGIPHIILFGPDGTILRRDLRGEEIEKAVATYVKPVRK